MDLRPPAHLARLNRDDLTIRFNEAWQLTDQLFSSLKTEECFLQSAPHGLRQPMIFYYGHPASFYLNKLRNAGLCKETIDPELESKFAVGVDEHAKDQIRSDSSHWPDLEQLNRFRTRVRDCVLKAIERAPLPQDSRPLDESSATWALLMAIEHELIHIETSSVLLREMNLGLLRNPKGWPAPHPDRPSFHEVPSPQRNDNPFVLVPGGHAHIGKRPEFSIYHWDNEVGSHNEHVNSFAIQRCLVSNEEYLSFVEAGGYADPKWWSQEGWQWREQSKRTQPVFWHENPLGDYELRTTFQLIPMPWRWPVIVNHHEATAFANWLSAETDTPLRLPNELEMARVRAWIDAAETRNYESWFHADRGSSSPYAWSNFGLRFGSESPVDEPCPFPVSDLWGNVWQWCADDFQPLEGFKPHPLYPDYSSPSFDGKHRLLLGGSFASLGCATGPWTRNNFRPHFHQHAGFRLVRPDSGPPVV